MLIGQLNWFLEAVSTTFRMGKSFGGMFMVFLVDFSIFGVKKTVNALRNSVYRSVKAWLETRFIAVQNFFICLFLETVKLLH